DQADDICADEGDNALEDGGEADVVHHALDDEHVHADGGMDQAELHGHDDDHPEPDRVKPQMHDDGEDDGDREDDHGHRVHQASEREVHDHDQRQHAVAAKTEAGEEFGDLLRRLRDGEEIAKQQGADQHGEYGGGRAGGLQQRAQDLGEPEAAASNTDQEGAGRADAACFGG